MNDDRLDPEQERELVEKARRDPESFRELYRRYFSRLYAYVAYRVGRAQDVEDLVSEIFTKVIEGLDRFEYRGDGAFAAWLFRIAHNQVTDFQRQSRARDEPLSLDLLPEIRDDALLPEMAILRKERFAYLRWLINTLSPRRQEIVTLKFFSGLRNYEIAAVLGLDERTVASHLCRGLEELYRKCAHEPMPMREGGIDEHTNQP